MPDNCENWLGLINTDVYYACQNRQIYQPDAALLNGLQSSLSRVQSSWGALKLTQ